MLRKEEKKRMLSIPLSLLSCFLNFISYLSYLHKFVPALTV